MTGVWVLLAVLVLASAFGVYRARTDGRMKVVGRGLPFPAVEIDADEEGSVAVPGAPPGEGHVHDGDMVLEADLGRPLGERATLVQFSSAFCAPCRTTRVVLDEVAGMVEGVAHVEIDAEQNLELVRRLDIRRTPTVLVVDADGRVRVRASGAPRKQDVLGALNVVV